MDIYTIFKFLHIVGAIAWIGGGVTLCAMGIFAERARNGEEMLRVLGGIGHMANRWFMPASLLTFICGIVMVVVYNLWSEAWIVLGLVGFFASFATGHFVLRLRAMAVKKHADAGNIPAAIAEGRKLLDVAKFDYVMLFMVVADMVLKPSWTDFVSLGFLAAVLAAAGWFFLINGLRKEAAAA